MNRPENFLSPQTNAWRQTGYSSKSPTCFGNNNIKSSEAGRILILLPQLLTLQAGRDLVAAASDIAIALDHSVNDCLYLALADNVGGQLVTADRELATKASEAGYDCRFLGDTRI